MARRVLFCTIGTTPQVVTETVWALARQTPPWHPDEIHVVTTSFKFSHICESLQGTDGPLARLLKTDVPPVAIHVPRREGSDFVSPPGSKKADHPADALHDVGTEQEAALIGNLILRLIAKFAREANTEIHVSLAGGRKTMSAHALMALSLVGRPHDRASHILVSPVDYEDNPNFWHPDQEGPIPRKEDREKTPPPRPSLDPAKANVLLIPTPAPLMRHRVAKGEDLTKLDLVELMAKANLAVVLQENPHVRLNVAANCIAAGGVTIRLGPKLFATYRLLATARKENWPGAGPNGIGKGHAGWLTFERIANEPVRPTSTPIRDLMTQYIKEAEVAEKKDIDDRNSVTAKWRRGAAKHDAWERAKDITGSLNPNISRLEEAIRDEVGPDSAAILAPCRNSERRGKTRFGLNIPANAIEIA